MSISVPKFGPEHYPAGSIIFRQGDLPDRFYLITQGEVEVIHRRPNGEESVINRLHTGEFFGEIGLLTNSRRVATIRTLTPVDVMAMDRDTFGNWLNTSMLSRDEINLVMAERMGNVEGLQPVEGDGQPAEKKESAGTTPFSTTASEAEETSRPVKQSSTPSPAPTLVDSGPHDFKPGDMIIRQGELADRFYIIIEGKVEVFQEEDGRKNHIAHLNSGNYFGEIGLLEGGTRMANVQAISQTSVMAFDRESFRKWLSEAPFVQDEIRFTLRRRLADNLEDANP